MHSKCIPAFTALIWPSDMSNYRSFSFAWPEKDSQLHSLCGILEIQHTAGYNVILVWL